MDIIDFIHGLILSGTNFRYERSEDEKPESVHVDMQSEDGEDVTVSFKFELDEFAGLSVKRYPF